MRSLKPGISRPPPVLPLGFLGTPRGWGWGGRVWSDSAAWTEGLVYLEMMDLDVASPLFGSKRLQGLRRWESRLPGDSSSLPPRYPPHTRCRPTQKVDGDVLGHLEGPHKAQPLPSARTVQAVASS